MKDKKKILVIGSTGMLGSALTEKLKAMPVELHLASWPVKANETFLLDITNHDSVEEAFDRIRPDVVYNCSAYTDVDGAEKNVELAIAVNSTAVSLLGQYCYNYKSLLVHISTDYVFDGKGNTPYKPDDKPSPRTAYGKSKLMGENAIMESQCEFLIIRTSWLFGPYGKNFVETIINLASTRDEIKVVDDQIGCPTYTLDLADAMIELAQNGSRGIYHFSNSPACSWYDFACEIVAAAGLSCKVNPCRTEDFPRPAPRPAYSVLDISKMVEALKHPVGLWKDSLRDYISKRK